MGPYHRVSPSLLLLYTHLANERLNSECLGVLQGHTSLVGQLQMRGDTLVTGGSDGSVRIWSLESKRAIHRLAAHDNSVTSLQFDETRVVSGGSDGRVKIWDLKTGQLVRELIAQGEAVWRVAFEEEKCVALALRSSRTIMEVSAGGPSSLLFTVLTQSQVWSFSPPEEMFRDRPLSLAQQVLEEDRSRPMSAMALDFKTAEIDKGDPSREGDVDMVDAEPGPSRETMLELARQEGRRRHDADGNQTFFDAD